MKLIRLNSNYAFRNYRAFISYTLRFQSSSAKATSSCYIKDVTGELPREYNPTEVEQGWYNWWQELGIFKLGSPNSGSGRPFSMVIPPPNITGHLHLGHALTTAIQDTLLRWHRMQGRAVVWVPGYDHAGIATQSRLEQHLLSSTGQSRTQMGQSKFLKAAVQWQNQKIETISRQLREMGAVLDFDRTVFTLDKHMSHAVNHAFISLFDEGLIYRGSHMINWCPHLQSVISDIEVDWKILPGPTELRFPGHSDSVKLGVMDYFAYPLSEARPQGPRELVIATTRIETMLGDQAVCVHPDDTRYCHLIGSTVNHPFTGQKLPILADTAVNPNMGTGVLKITPSHDPLDYQLGAHHGLPLCDVFDAKGHLKADLPHFGGMNRFEAKKAIRSALEQLGLYRGLKDHPTKIPLCSRSGDLLEYRITPQWFLNTSAMVQDAIEVVESGQLDLVPDGCKAIWFEFLKKNPRDWCISRQLWWGHELPVYQVRSPEKSGVLYVAANSETEAEAKAVKQYGLKPGTFILQKETDVLDTWFSSALFPMASLGWPGKMDIEAYPLSLMETGHDILFFWVVKMVMLGRHFTGQLPFPRALLHGLVLDGRGRKMSKSCGNVVDPCHVIHGASLKELQADAEPQFRSLVASNFPQGIPQCGADSLRFALLLNDIKSGTIRMDIINVRSTRHFCNKIWQGCRFAQLFKSKHFPNCLEMAPPLQSPQELEESSPENSWILSRLARLVERCGRHLEDFDFHHSTLELRMFWVQDFCDFYLESLKLVEAGTPHATAAQRTLDTVIHTYLRLLAPFMPFLSEELYQRMAQQPCQSIFKDCYPSSHQWEAYQNPLLEKKIALAREIIFKARSLKVHYGVGKDCPQVTAVTGEDQSVELVESIAALICGLARLQSIHFVSSAPAGLSVDNSAREIVGSSLDLYLHLEGLVADPTTTSRKRLEKELSKVVREMSYKLYSTSTPEWLQQEHLHRRAWLEARLAELPSIPATASTSSL